MNQITAKDFLEQSVFPTLEAGLNHLLETIESNGEYTKYVEMLAERQEKESRDLRRRERERRRVAQGDDFVSSESENEDDDDNSDFDEETSDYDDDELNH